MMVDATDVERYALHHADCIDAMLQMAGNSVDALVTDPPAGIAFMGRDWDHDKGGRDAWIAWLRERMVEARRVMKPGAYGLVWALPRTSHWTAMALEDAGLEIRDRVSHLFGTGFPKSLDVSKALDRHLGSPRDVQGEGPSVDRTALDFGGATGKAKNGLKATFTRDDEARTELARQWAGWGTALKPAVEDWWLVRKPLEGTVAANVEKWGTGGINVDGCRIPINPGVDDPRLGGKGTWSTASAAKNVYGGGYAGERVGSSALGRWPANLVLDEEAAAMLDEQSGDKCGACAPASGPTLRGGNDSVARGHFNGLYGDPAFHGDTGGASRFFYCAKASTADREEGLPTQTDGRANKHPTVKATELMRWLCRLVTPMNGVILDPFMGSGSTGKAAMLEGFRFVGCEMDAESFETAKGRIEWASQQGVQARLL